MSPALTPLETRSSVTATWIPARCPVVNNTGLEGNYDFKLEWTPDPGPPAPGGQPVETSLGPSLFTALQQQLGLRLEATKGPVDMLIIDHVDKPSEN